MTIRDYGLCPQCHEVGMGRERRMNGNDRCAAGHVYPSADSLCSCTAMTKGYCGSRACKNHRHGWPSERPSGVGQAIATSVNLMTDLQKVKELIEVLESHILYYEEREDDARICAEYVVALTRSGAEKEPYASARRYLSGDYPTIVPQ